MIYLRYLEEYGRVKMKKLLYFLAFILVICFSVPQISMASEPPTEGIELPPEASQVGSLIPFEGVPDVETEQSINNDQECIACVGGRKIKATVLSGPTKIKTKFVRYLSSSWTYSKEYTWGVSNSVSSNLSASVSLTAKEVSAQLGVTNSYTTVYDVVAVIPADSKRLNKLAFYSDYNKRYIKVVTTMAGATVSTEYADHFAPLKDSYVLVAYK